MFSNYARTYEHEDDIQLLQGLSHQRQYFLLRKQFDDRMRKLASISKLQRIRIAKYENYIDKSLQDKEEA